MQKVSVIVPVYNVEPYLEKCLESLINQTLEEIEVIVVDDGSTDGSAGIIEEFAKKSSKIRSLTKVNGGLSDARNYGMKYAAGEYIGFIDSDDFVDLEMYEKLYEKAKEEDSDIVECNLHHTFADYEDTEIGEKITDKKKMLMDGRSVVWNKIYKREWLETTEIRFPKGLIYEDVDFFVRLIPHIRVYSYIDGAYVHYVQRSSSINNLSSKKTLDILSVLKHILNYYQKQEKFYQEYHEALEYFFARILLCSSFSRMCRIADRTERKVALQKNYRMLVKHFPDWKKNPYLKQNTSKKGMFMKSVNGGTYRIYCAILPVVVQIQNRMKKWK